MILVLALVAVLLVVIFGIRTLMSSKPIKGVQLLAGLSIAGEFNKNPAQMLINARKKYGDIFTLDLFLLRMTIAFKLDDIQKFLKAPESEMTIKSTERFVKAVVGPDAFSRDEATQPDSHAYIEAGFLRPEPLQNYIDLVREEARQTWAKLAARDEFDLFPEISRFIVLSNILCFIGRPTYERYADKFARAYYDIETNAFKPLSLLAPWLPTSSTRLVARSRQILTDIFTEEIKKRLANLEEYAENVDFFQLTISRAAQEGFPPAMYPHWFSTWFTTLFFAAHTNTAGTFAWSAAHLADNSTWQERARQECQAAVKNESDPVTLSTLQALTFLDCVMKETVRSYAQLFMTRKTMVPVEVGGVVIPKGEMIAISPYMTHHDPAYYPDPFVYNPDRFEGEAAQKHFEDRTYIQFGYGPHRCSGEKFANVVLKTGWLVLFSKYRVEILSPIPPPDFSRAVGMPFCQGSIRARLHKLEQM